MERLPMHQIREILRLRWVLGLGVRQAAAAAGVGRSVVSKTSNRAQRAGLDWSAVEVLSDVDLERKLYGTPQRSASLRAEPDLAYIHAELRRPGVTLELLHLEYLQSHPDGYRYTAYCNRYRAWQKKVGVWMRQVHHAGDKSFVDYSGKRPHLIDSQTGERVYVELFVGVLGASSYTFAEATQTQQIPDFVGSHVRMFEYFGGVTKTVVPDQLRSAVSVPSRSEPLIARTYSDLGRHYGTAIVPARPRKPRDKAKVEVAVQVAQRWILARLRNETFFSLQALNERIRELLTELNARPMKKMGGKSRRDLYESHDKPALLPLPAGRFECSEWSRATVHGDHHIQVGKHCYSVPYALVHEVVDVRLTASTLEVLHQGARVTSHVRSYAEYGTTTKPEHRPPNHREWAQADTTSVIAWAQSIGPLTHAYVHKLIELRPTGLRSALGLRRVSKVHEPARIEAACELALRLGGTSYKPVERILRLGPKQQERAERTQSIGHTNVRGPTYFH
jgi:transposase